MYHIWIAAEFPDLSMGDMSKKLGEMWKEASSEEKDTYKVHSAYLHIRAYLNSLHGKAA